MSSKKAAATRLNILQKAFELVYQNGYRTTSVDEIIATTQVTKGAFFYHFKNKDEMGLAMINEVMQPGMRKSLIEALPNNGNPVEEIYNMMESLLLKDPFFIIKYGCPAINMVEEMASYNEAFNKALSQLVIQWEEAITTTLEKGKTIGKINPDTNPKEVAQYIISGYGGIRNLGKIYGKPSYISYLSQFKNYLNTLK
ncbi:TetR/AcrR family transcriptional regulator [Flavobacterium beibuense]|uniref:TetR/AcrR family transcriptional regulator n=1 Tax=Flavobacterium beibuense TaxID=657326 RepID=UPI003A91491E